MLTQDERPCRVHGWGGGAQGVEKLAIGQDNARIRALPRGRHVTPREETRNDGGPYSVIMPISTDYGRQTSYLMHMYPYGVSTYDLGGPGPRPKAKKLPSCAPHCPWHSDLLS